MSQILDPVPSYEAGRAILCTYLNATSKIQVARIKNIPNWYFERVVFPGQRLTFTAVPEADLEIHSGMMASSILSDRIPCYRLTKDARPELPLEFYCAPADFSEMERQPRLEKNVAKGASRSVMNQSSQGPAAATTSSSLQEHVA